MIKDPLWSSEKPSADKQVRAELHLFKRTVAWMILIPGIARKKPTKKEEKEERGSAWLASMAPLIPRPGPPMQEPALNVDAKQVGWGVCWPKSGREVVGTGILKQGGIFNYFVHGSDVLSTLFFKTLERVFFSQKPSAGSHRLPESEVHSMKPELRLKWLGKALQRCQWPQRDLGLFPTMLFCADHLKFPMGEIIGKSPEIIRWWFLHHNFPTGFGPFLGRPMHDVLIYPWNWYRRDWNFSKEETVLQENQTINIHKFYDKHTIHTINIHKFYGKHWKTSMFFQPFSATMMGVFSMTQVRREKWRRPWSSTFWPMRDVSASSFHLKMQALTDRSVPDCFRRCLYTHVLSFSWILFRPCTCLILFNHVYTYFAN